MAIRYGRGDVKQTTTGFRDPRHLIYQKQIPIPYPYPYKLHSIKPVELDELLEKADIVTLHTPLDDSTCNILNKQKLELLKPSAILINAARGGLVDEVALRNMLQSNRLAAAAFDVFSVEPPEDKGLLELPNFLVTPHIGGSAEEAILAMGRAAINGFTE